MSQKRESNRIKEANQRKVLEEATRKERLEKSIAALERDNYHEDPNPELKFPKREKKIEDTFKKEGGQEVKTEFRKNFAALSEDEKDYFIEGETNYVTARVPPSRYPPRHFCAVCGFPSNYTCVQCGARYCCIKCFGIHKGTRCSKFTA